MQHPRRTFTLFVVCTGLSVLVAANAACGGDAWSLRIDYLPNLIYDGEVLTLSAAVTRARRGPAAPRRGFRPAGPLPDGTEREIEVTARLTAGDVEYGKAAAKVIQRAGHEFPFRASWPMQQLRQPLTLVIELQAVIRVREGDRVVSERSKELDRAVAIVYPASLDLPELDVEDAHLIDRRGHRAILVVRRQIRERESRWALIKLAESVVTGGKVTPVSPVFIGDLLARRESESYVARLRQRAVMKHFSYLVADHPVRCAVAAPPILRTLAAFSRGATSRRHSLAMLFVGTEEFRLGTDVQEFRKAIDLMCGALKQHGTRHIVLVAPVCPRILHARVARYRRVVRSVAYAAGARVVDPQPAVLAAGWGPGRRPSAAARRALADHVARFVESIVAK
jgi:hypothetical protein